MLPDVEPRFGADTGGGGPGCSPRCGMAGGQARSAVGLGARWRGSCGYAPFCVFAE